MHILRWLLTVPAAIVGWYIGVIVALIVHTASERLCPLEYVVSGTCIAPWMAFVSDAYLALGSLICGSLAVLLPTLIAPSHRAKIALLAYIAGLACSAYWVAHGLWVPVAWAALAGAATLWRIRIVLTHHSIGTSNGSP
jgi:hypothetical protein